MTYVELQVTTCMSFLHGASHPDELLVRAFETGFKTLAITDRNSLAGVVRAHVAAKQLGVRPIIGCRLDLEDGPSLLAYPTDKDAYARLSALLTLGNLRTEKGSCLIRRQDVYEHATGIKFIAVPPLALNELFDFPPDFENVLREYREALGRSLSLAATCHYRGDDAKRLYRLGQMSRRVDVPMVATNDVLYHDRTRRDLQDVMTCIKQKCTIFNAGFKINPNAEHYLKPASEMARLFKDYPAALDRTLHIADACRFSLDELKYVYPKETTSVGRTPQEELVLHTWEGARERYGNDIPAKITETLHKELDFIASVDYAPYFLTVHDIVRFARSRGILCQGRGSAANSTVCYCLGITSVNPAKFDLLFERFLSTARNEPPDIDIDFDHVRREEVIQYIYTKYGRDRAAIVATVSEQHQKGAIADVGRAMNLSNDIVTRMSGTLDDFQEDWLEDEKLKKAGIDIADPHLCKTIEMARKMLGMPRQLGQHTGGFVITDGKLSDLCPVFNARMEDRTNIEWTKYDIEPLGFLKIDILGLGMLTCIRMCFEAAKRYYGQNYTLANLPQDDPVVYDMICRADTVGVFQIESRAQKNMLPRVKPRNFYDLVVEIALVRPGPNVGGMVHPYLRRRMGKEAVTYPSKELEEILGRTLGCMIFQEQAMKIAIVAAGFTPAEADELRRCMATFKFQGLIDRFEEKLVRGMVAKGYEEAYARQTFRQLEGFGSYGFPESHSASFAHLVYASAWLKCHYPDVFVCGLLNAQPMGYYSVSDLLSDATKHGVEVRPIDVNASDWDNTLEVTQGRYRALRLGLRQIKGIKEADMRLLVAKRGDGYSDIADVFARGLSQSALHLLADADAFQCFGKKRREALWEVKGLGSAPLTLFSGLRNQGIKETPVVLPVMPLAEEVAQDFVSTAFSLKGHLVQFAREKLDFFGVHKIADIRKLKNGVGVTIAGIRSNLQRPPTANGVWFLTLVDETDNIDLVIRPDVVKKFSKTIQVRGLICAYGRIQLEDGVLQLLARNFEDRTDLLQGLNGEDNEEDMPLFVPPGKSSRIGLVVESPYRDGKPIIPPSRDFR